MGILECEVSGKVQSDGFYTVDIPDVELDEGERYSVVMTFSGDDGSGYVTGLWLFRRGHEAWSGVYFQ